MYKRKHYLYFIFLFFTFSSVVVVSTSSTSNSPALSVQTKYELDVQQLSFQVVKLNAAISLYLKDKKALPLLQLEFCKTRLAYKKAEIFIEYFNKDLAQKFFNGAPLPKMMQGVDWIEVQEPEGLQVLDEIIFSDSIDSNLLKEKGKSFVKNITDFSANRNINIQDRNVFEAARIELIRVFTLGLTGFDAPASGNSMEEAYVSLLSVQKAIQPYSSMIKSRNRPTADSLNLLLKEGLKYLQKNNDFHKFDRM
ncbi:MAG TPA: hypothetical protein VF691_22900, partial [Cytophagaceae bacterium]